jgi:hypothetical protein
MPFSTLSQLRTIKQLEEDGLRRQWKTDRHSYTITVKLLHRNYNGKINWGSGRCRLGLKPAPGEE